MLGANWPIDCFSIFLHYLMFFKIFFKFQPERKQTSSYCYSFLSSNFNHLSMKQLLATKTQLE